MYGFGMIWNHPKQGTYISESTIPQIFVLLAYHQKNILFHPPKKKIKSNQWNIHLLWDPPTLPFPAKTPAHQHLPLWLCSRARKFLHASRHQKHVPRDAVALATHSTSRSTKASPVPPVPMARCLQFGGWLEVRPLTQKIHVGCIYLHLGGFNGKCR